MAPVDGKLELNDTNSAAVYKVIDIKYDVKTAQVNKNEVAATDSDCIQNNNTSVCGNDPDNENHNIQTDSEMIAVGNDTTITFPGGT